MQDDVFRAMGQMLPSLSPVTHTHRVVSHLLLTGPREKSASAVRVLCGEKHNMGHSSPPQDSMRPKSSMIFDGHSLRVDKNGHTRNALRVLNVALWLR